VSENNKCLSDSAMYWTQTHCY